MKYSFKLDRPKYTQKIIDFAFKYPWLVPGYLHYYAEEYHSDSEEINKRKNENPEYSKVSLLSGDFHWKSISYSMLINDDELINLKKWMKKRSIYVDGIRNRNIESRSFDNDSGWVNIGYTRINDDSYIDDLTPYYFKDDYFKGVGISLAKYSTGLSFITFYIMLKDEVTSEAKDVDVPNMKYFTELDTFNIFSRKNVGLKIKSYHEFSIQILTSNMIKVESSARQFLSDVLKDIKISKNEDELCCVSDFYINDSRPYFDYTNNIDRDDENIVIRKQRGVIDSKISLNKSESYINKYFHDVNGFDWFYLYSLPESELTPLDNFKTRISLNSESHLAIIPVFLIRKKLDNISGYINDTKLHNAQVSLELLHERLFSVSYQLEVIILWLKSLKKDLGFYLSEDYKDNARLQVGNLTERAERLKGITSSLYSLSENRIQVNNVKYNKKLSWVVLFFAIVQIFLAAMTIDPSKKDAWYYPLVSWLKNSIF